MSSSNTDSRTHTVRRYSPPFLMLLRAERLRMFSTRGTWVLVMLGLFLPGMFTGTFLLTIGKPGGISLKDPTAVATILSAGSSAALMATLLGVLSVTTEYRHGTAALSLMPTGHRSFWIFPKLVVAGLSGLLITVFGQVIVLAVGILGLRQHGVSINVTKGELLWSSLGTASLGLFAATFGVGFGLCIRNQLAAVVGVVIYTTMAEAAFLHFVPSVGRYLIGGANAAVAQDPTLQHLVDIPMGYLLLVGWVVLAFAVGYWRLTSEDVPSD